MNDFNPNELNGMKILGQRNGTIFVRLPKELQRPIDGCICSYCKEHPQEPPTWDTLALAVICNKNVSMKRNDTTFTVHMPDASDAY